MRNTPKIELSDERKKMVVEEFMKFYLSNYDEELSAYRAGMVCDFFIEALGPSLYNQAIQDARAFMLQKLEDLDVDLYYPDQNIGG